MLYEYERCNLLKTTVLLVQHHNILLVEALVLRTVILD